MVQLTLLASLAVVLLTMYAYGMYALTRMERKRKLKRAQVENTCGPSRTSPASAKE